MIIVENITIDGREFTRTTSDAGRYVVRDDIAYEEAYDPAEFGRVYTEGDVIPVTEATTEDKAEAYDILTGVSK